MTDYCYRSRSCPTGSQRFTRLLIGAAILFIVSIYSFEIGQAASPASDTNLLLSYDINTTGGAR